MKLYAAAPFAFRPSMRFLNKKMTLGPNDSSIIAIPVAIPKPVTNGAQQS